MVTDEVERFAEICEAEIRKGGDYRTRLVEMPIYRRLDKEYDNLVDLITTVENRLFDGDPLGFFISSTWDNMVDARCTLKQVPKGTPIEMECAEDESVRLITGLYYYYKEHIDAYLKEHTVKDVNTRVYTYVKERVEQMQSERDKLYLESELKDIARGLWETHPQFTTDEIVWLMEMYANAKVNRYMFSNGRDKLISLVCDSKNVVLLEV